MPLSTSSLALTTAGLSDEWTDAEDFEVIQLDEGRSTSRPVGSRAERGFSRQTLDLAARDSRERLGLFKARALVESTREQAGAAHEREGLLPTSLPAVDELLSGGLARGETIEAVGWRSSGRFSMVLSTLAATTQSGEQAALIDLGDHLDPEAATLAGVDLERMLWMRPEHIKQALSCAELVLSTGFPLVIVDVGTPPLPGGRGPESAWLRLQRSAIDHDCALLISSPYRVTGTAAQAVLELHRGLGGWLGRGHSPRLLASLQGEVELAKARLPRLRRARLKRLRAANGALTRGSSGKAEIEANLRYRSLLGLSEEFELRYASGSVAGYAEPVSRRRRQRSRPAARREAPTESFERPDRLSTSEVALLANGAVRRAG